MHFSRKDNVSVAYKNPVFIAFRTKENRRIKANKNRNREKKISYQKLCVKIFDHQLDLLICDGRCELQMGKRKFQDIYLVLIS